jgi:uncharacterized membrane protein YphA (DoxX/SURF4 family)
MKYITNIARVIIGLVFIISGLLKANDPTGFGFKLHEYFEYFNVTFLNQFAFAISMIVSILEILLGYALLIGLKPKITVWCTAVLIAFFWFLVFEASKTTKLSDCGCFGDAIKFTPKRELLNDTIFMALIIVMLFGLKYIKPLFNGAISMVSFILVIFLSMGFTIRNYLYLPAIDFLPFKEGNSIQEKMKSDDPDIYSSKFVYTYLPTGADSVIDEARLKALYKQGIDSLYKWKKTMDPALIHEGVHPPVHDFIIKDETGNDVTLSFFADDYKLVMTSYDLNKVSRPVLEKFAKLSDDWRKTGKEFWGLTNSEHQVTEKVRHDNQLFIDFYTLDATPIKMMVRSNPGLMLIKKDKVIKKWSSFALPTMEQVKTFMEP